MKQLNSSAKLDAVLKYVADHRDKEISANEVFGYLQVMHPGVFIAAGVKNLLKILVNHRHIANTLPGFYQANLSGIVFLENGGYTQKYQANYVKRQYLKMAHKSGNQTNSMFVWFLAIIAYLPHIYLLNMDTTTGIGKFRFKAVYSC